MHVYKVTNVVSNWKPMRGDVTLGYDVCKEHDDSRSQMTGQFVYLDNTA